MATAVDVAHQGHRHEGIPWEWVLEHLVDNRHVETSVLGEMTRYITDEQCRSSLQRRISLRYLEEMIASSTFDAHAIPLVRTILEGSISGHMDLLLRVQIEAVLTHIRVKPRNWHLFRQALDLYLPADSRDSQLLQKREVFLALLESLNKENKCMEILEAYSIDLLRHDLLKCIALEKLRFQRSFLSQIFEDVLGGSYLPQQVGEVGPLNPKKDKHNHCTVSDSQGSDDPTVIGGGRNSDADSEESPISKCGRSTSANVSKDGPSDVTKKRDAMEKECNGSAVCLHQRDQYGKAMTSPSTLDRRQVDGQFKNECIKCRKPGLLVSCIGCPMAVHRDCLGSDTSISIEEEWYCPLCLQKKAADALLLAKKEERVARERLAKFLEGTDAKKRLSTTLALLSKREEKVNRKEAKLDPNLKKDSQVKPCMHASRKSAEISALELREESIPEGENEKSVTPSKAGVDPSVCHSKERSFNRTELEAESMLGDIKVAHLIKTQSEEVERQNGGGCEGEPLQLLSEDHGLKLNPTCMHIAPNSRQFEEHAPEADAHDGELEEDRQFDEVSRRARSASREKHLPGMPRRRKRLHWSKEEEDTLKEGVKKFSCGNGEWGFQWTRIMDFGKEKFHPSRTVVDLKDKWRNLLRSHGKAASSSD